MLNILVFVGVFLIVGIASLSSYGLTWDEAQGFCSM
jgi:hypothetical protein